MIMDVKVQKKENIYCNLKKTRATTGVFCLWGEGWILWKEWVYLWDQ